MSEVPKERKKQIKDELAKKKRVREAYRTYVSKMLHTTEQILENLVQSSMEALQSNVYLLKEKADGIENLDSCILELLCEDGSADLEKEIEETSEFARRIKDDVCKAERLSKPEEVKGTRNRTKEHQVGPFHYSPVRNYLSCLSKDSLVIQKVGSRSGIPLTLLFMRMHL